MIIDEIKKANIQAMKDRNSNLRAIYSIMINKHMQADINARTSGAIVDDAEMIRIIQKTIKELIDESENFLKVGNQERAKLIAEQKNVIEKFLPQMMSENDIKKVIMGFDDKSIPFVMRYFKENFDGKCEMRMVQQVLRSL